MNLAGQCAANKQLKSEKIKDPSYRTEQEYTNKIHDNKNRITKASVRRRLPSLHLTCSV